MGWFRRASQRRTAGPHPGTAYAEQDNGAFLPVGPLYSVPLPQRNEGLDTKGVWQALPFDQQFLTYWIGNQLPQALRVGIGSQQVQGWYTNLYAEEFALPQLNAGARPLSMGLVPLSQMLQELRDKWQSIGS